MMGESLTVNSHMKIYRRKDKEVMLTRGAEEELNKWHN